MLLSSHYTTLFTYEWMSTNWNSIHVNIDIDSTKWLSSAYTKDAGPKCEYTVLGQLFCGRVQNKSLVNHPPTRAISSLYHKSELLPSKCSNVLRTMNAANNVTSGSIHCFRCTRLHVYGMLQFGSILGEVGAFRKQFRLKDTCKSLKTKGRVQVTQ